MSGTIEKRFFRALRASKAESRIEDQTGVGEGLAGGEKKSLLVDLLRAIVESLFLSEMYFCCVGKSFCFSCAFSCSRSSSLSRPPTFTPLKQPHLSIGDFLAEAAEGKTQEASEKRGIEGIIKFSIVGVIKAPTMPNFYAGEGEENFFHRSRLRVCWCATTASRQPIASRE